ncbi:c-type cytochrome [Dankookia sp. GCM10030260]|uniref:c-type cytochrome n=1 Tax=Dankookia sp. GCM10030260 TaxID=3273390 RepID=UPI0036111CBE
MTKRFPATGFPGLSRRQFGLSLILLLATGCEAEEPAALQVVGGDPGRGPAVILAAGCGACHVIPGVRGAVAWVGPPLMEWSRRGYVGGRLPNTPENLTAWLRDPQAISPGSAMPALGLSEAEARDAAAYLFTLGAGRLPPVPAGLPLGPNEGGPREMPRIRPRA